MNHTSPQVYSGNSLKSTIGGSNISLIFSAITGILTFGLFQFWNRFQPALEISDVLSGWDAVQYRALYHQLKNGTSEIALEAPFSQRIFTPFFASLFNLSPVESFKLTSLIFAVSTNAIIAFVSHRLCGTKGALYIIIPLLFYFLAPVKIANYSPFINDPSLLFFESLIILVLYLRVHFLFLLILPLGMLAKESFWIIGIIPVLWMLTKNIFFKVQLSKPEKKLATYLFAGCVLALGVKFLLPFAFNFITPSSQLGTLVKYFYVRATDPTSLSRLLAAVFLTMAQYVFLAAWNRRAVLHPVFTEGQYTACSICWIGLHFFFICFAGEDMTRIFFNGYPLYIFVFAQSIKNTSWISLVITSMAGLYFQHVVHTIPIPASTIPDSDLKGLFSWFMEYAHIGIVTNILFTAAFLCFLFYHLGKFLDHALSQVKSRS